MTVERSSKSLQRERKRNSLETQKTRDEIEIFFKKTGLPDPVKYKIRIDLSTKTDMPYYGRDKGARYSISPKETIRECCYRLIDYGDMELAEKLLKLLTQQQNQSFRKMSKKHGQKKEKDSIWEHPIPVKVSRTILYKYIEEGNRQKINDFLTFISDIPQIAIPKEIDHRLTSVGLKDAMPKGWNWEISGSQFARYTEVGFDYLEFLL